MIGQITKRLSLLVPTIVGITLVAFLLIHLLPGDAIEMMAGERGLSAERHAELKKELGLDLPLWQQYFHYLTNITQGNFGHSFVTREPVLNEFLTLLPATIELSLCAMLIAIIIGLPLGIIAAVKRGTWVDHSVMGFSLTGYSMPIFWWALLLILLFSVQWDLTPVSGRIDVSFWIDEVTGFMLIDSILSQEPGAFTSAVHHLILPSLVLSTIPMAVITRMTRSSLLEVLSEDYMRTAKAKGVSSIRLIIVHGLRNALIPIVTVIGLQVGTLFTGAILTETIFSWPGIGKWLIDAIGRRDFPVIQGGLLFIAFIMIAVNLSVDLLYKVIDPRQKNS